MSGPDVLGGGPSRDRASRLRPGHGNAGRRRAAGVAGTVLVAAAAAVLAVRTPPEPAPAPGPEPTGGVVVADPGRFVVDIAVGTRWAYALLASCFGPEQARECSYQLVRRSLDGGAWSTTRLRTELVAGSGILARLFVTGDDLVTVLDQPTVGTVYASADGGDTVGTRPLRPGPPIAALPPGAVLDAGLCESCIDRLTVLEPGTGRLRPLANQPPLLPTFAVRAVAESGGVLWALGDGGSRLVTAASVDRGRSWRRLPVGGARAPADIARILSDGGLGAYLVLGRDHRPDVLNELSELWLIGDATRPGATWRQVTPTPRPRSAASLVAGARGLLVSEEDGGLWRLGSDGRMRRLPPADLDGVPVSPGYTVTGPGRVLVAVPDNQPDPGWPTLMVSSDEGESWLVEQVRA